LLSPEFTVSVVVSQISFEETFDDCFSEIDWDKIDTDEDDWDAELKDIAFNYAGLFDNAAFPFQQAVPFNKLELLPKESRRELRTYVCEVSFVFVSAFVWVCFFSSSLSNFSCALRQIKVLQKLATSRGTGSDNDFRECLRKETLEDALTLSSAELGTWLNA